MTGVAAPAARQPRRTVGAWLWFAAMAGGWIAVWAAVALSAGTLEAVHDAVRDLPLVAELLAWLLFFPFTLALTIWESGWDEWLRLALVACCTVGWTLAFFPWRKS